MRIDARDPAFTPPWLVWDCERCEEIKRVTWADDSPPAYCQVRTPLQVVNGEVLADVHRVRRVRIVADAKLVLVNPVEDIEDTALRLGERLRRTYNIPKIEVTHGQD